VNTVDTMVGINTVGFIENPPKIKLLVIKVSCEKRNEMKKNKNRTLSRRLRFVG